MSKFDDMIDWVSGYTRAVNERKALELYQREVETLEYKGQQGRAVRNYIKRQLDDGCAYVILPNNIARNLVGAASDWERDSTGTETIREKRKR